MRHSHRLDKTKDAQLPNRDWWDVVARALDAANAWNLVRVEKVAAHMDKAKSWGEMTLHEWGNYEADDLIHGMQDAPLVAEGPRFEVAAG